jgi:hypothetical protein
VTVPGRTPESIFVSEADYNEVSSPFPPKFTLGRARMTLQRTGLNDDVDATSPGQDKDINAENRAHSTPLAHRIVALMREGRACVLPTWPWTHGGEGRLERGGGTDGEKNAVVRTDQLLESTGNEMWPWSLHYNCTEGSTRSGSGPPPEERDRDIYSRLCSTLFKQY